MTIAKIARMGHPVLMSPAKPVEDPSSPQIRQIITDMVETLQDAAGAGLAAPQIHIPLRIVIFSAPGERNPDDSMPDPRASAPFTVLINPQITIIGEETAESWEGCLSVPGLRGAVTRPAHIRYKGLGLDGGIIQREATGFHARVVQHECDHLDGILYPQRMMDMSRFLFESELKYWVK